LGATNNLLPGSIFNHSEYPNVSFSLDRSSQSIRYTTSRSVAVDEELCIFYGHQLWFDDIDRVQTSGPRNIDEAQGQDALPLMKDEVTDEDSIQPQEPIDSLWDRLTARWHLENPGEAVAIEALPFESVRTTPPDPEEETAESVLTS
jgi:tRNA-specific adenosine deaminase 3